MSGSPNQSLNQRRYRATEHVRSKTNHPAREWYLRKRQLVDQIKLKTGCTDCGYSDHAAALQFDHVRGDKVEAVSQMVTWSWGRIQAEIAKCEVVCANCHSIRTWTRRRKGTD